MVLVDDSWNDVLSIPFNVPLTSAASLEMRNWNPSLEISVTRLLFDLEWQDVNVEHSLVAIAPYGAAIAVYSLDLEGSIEVYTGSGASVMTIAWPAKLGEVAYLGWTQDFQLIVVLRHGKYRVYTDYNGDFEEYEIGSDVIEVSFMKNGFVAQTLAGFKHIVYHDHTVIDLFNVEENNVGWNVVPAVFNSELKVIVSTKDALIVNGESVQNSEVLKYGPFRFVSAAPNGDFVALYGADSETVEWCGNDAVIVCYADEMLLIGPSDESITFYLDSFTRLRPELDGLLYLDQDHLQFVSRVSNYTAETFRIGSTSPSAILLDAIDQIDHQSPKANENLEIISTELSDAVDHCIRAAAEEFDSYWQKKLLRAASFGKTTLEMYNADEFVETCDNLRILNIIRQPEVGIFLTYIQFTELGLDRLIDLLLLRKQHYLCLKIADFMDLPKDNIYINWACEKIRLSELNNEDMLADILKHLKGKFVSYAQISQVAYVEGRSDLATKLLSLETDVTKAIPLLLQMGQDASALNKADESMDLDSIVYVLVSLMNKVTRADFLKMLNRKASVSGVFLTLLASKDLQLLGDYYYKEDSIIGLSLVELNKLDTATDKQKERQLLNKASQTLARSKFTSSESKWLKEEAKNVDLKAKLEQELGIEASSSFELLEAIIRVDLKRATKVQKDLKISDKQFYYKVLKTYAQIPDKRRELYDFAVQKQSPIGYEPFYLESLKVGDKRHASIYLSHCNSMPYKTKVQCYINCDDYKSAIEEAYKRKDVETISLIKGLTENTLDSVDSLLSLRVFNGCLLDSKSVSDLIGAVDPLNLRLATSCFLSVVAASRDGLRARWSASSPRGLISTVPSA
ncbi:hypothetical protein OGAPHI_000726 [Ogataea philodendri]|uniref:Probable vacuolar protein sorting-associated protein 16 homolog n=1 Tax=Ogataea philodendri TaxID=1378263 RepID=A0A9P8TA60_9ASCO|nr:uncharacterized protein OGAPHI_000726 [Ogataea philodendri]KAH3671015.1 hypothetical protein OGAPHI_000726 [Ogataea philodendri]